MVRRDTRHSVQIQHILPLHHQDITTHTLWHGRKPSIAQLFPFGQLGHIVIATARTKIGKLDATATPNRNMYGIDENLIMVLNLRTGKYIQEQNTDFYSYNPQLDPALQTAGAFKAFTAHRTPKEITTSTPAPSFRGQAKRYPDAAEWQIAHDAELKSLENLQAIKWLPSSKLPAKLIPLIMTYRYKRDHLGKITSRKARSSVQGDLMQPSIHYNAKHTPAHLSQKLTARLLLALAATKSLHLDHFDTTAAFPHETCKYEKPVYIKKHPRFDGSTAESEKGGQLIKNLYGTLS